MPLGEGSFRIVHEENLREGDDSSHSAIFDDQAEPRAVDRWLEAFRLVPVANILVV